MDEARRFLRYILPGLVFSVVLLIALLISDNDAIICFLKKISDKGIIGIGGVFLASGALGYIFSVIYWALFWSRPFSNWIAVDHTVLLNRLVERGRVEVVDISGNQVPLDKRTAWVIFSQHWWTSRIKNKSDKDIFIPIDRLADITHAIGTAIISILFSFIVWAIIHYGYLRSRFSICDVGVLAFLVQIFLIIAFYKNYWDTHRSLQSVLNSAFANMVETQFEENKGKIRIYYSE